MAHQPTIHVTGDAYTAFFYLPPRNVFLNGVVADEAYVHALPVGVEYIFRAVSAACAPGSLLNDSDQMAKPRHVSVTRTPGSNPFQPESKKTAFYQIRKVDEVAVLGSTEKRPLLRFASADSQGLNLCGVTPAPTGEKKREGKSTTKPDVLVHWFGEMAGNSPRVAGPAPKPHSCRFHIQVGLAAPLGKKSTEGNTLITPGDMARPSVARLVVVNIGEISGAHRVRRTLSYEAAAVDLLRHLRGDGSGRNPVASEALHEISFVGEKAADLSILAVRLNNSAVFVYACRKVRRDSRPVRTESDPKGSRADQKVDELGAWLFCHERECAPLSQPELGQMVGFTGFVSAHLAAAMAVVLEQYGPGSTPTWTTLCDAVKGSVRRALGWQRRTYERGCLHMLLRKVNETWQPTPTAVNGRQRLGYDYLFAEIIPAINHDFRLKKFETGNTQNPENLAEEVKRFDLLFDGEILCVEVDIARAVAHRTQWFMARSVVAAAAGEMAATAGRGNAERRFGDISDRMLEQQFLKRAIGWLTAEEKRKDIPIVEIGNARLTDRREIEDYLAIRQVSQVYANTTQDKIPLNIAVFGAPGAGKSFAVKQVVSHLSKTYQGVFKKDALTFNLGQFKNLDDLPAALHLVRNECLSPEIPIVFFDEFDSTFNGQPFGWLKFFLAPMQDGEFYHAGHTFRLGRAVFVFAGGVNRSFEELNGRVRNPSFCEAKGPDFISRLKAHLNVQGVNKPEEDADQSRYILRRAVMLRDIVRQKLRVTKEQGNVPLLHRSVANALLRVERFKHGVRSMEAIVKMCTARPGARIGPSDLPSMDQLEMHVDASKLLKVVEAHEYELAFEFRIDLKNPGRVAKTIKTLDERITSGVVDRVERNRNATQVYMITRDPGRCFDEAKSLLGDTNLWREPAESRDLDVPETKFHWSKIQSCADKNAILRIINESAEAYRGVILEDYWRDRATYMLRAQLELEIDAGVRFWACSSNDSLLGVMGIQEVEQDNEVALIRHAYVLPKSRGQGIGSDLLHALRKLAPNKPVLVATWTSASRAVKFYEKNGFVRVKDKLEKNVLLKKYWKLSEKWVPEYIVLGDKLWHETIVNKSRP